MYYEREQKKQLEKELINLIEENVGDALDHLDSSHKQMFITRLKNNLVRAGIYTRQDICEATDLHKRRGLSGRVVQIVIQNIKGENYDERKIKEERIAEIDRTINRLLKEKASILKSLE